MFSYVRMYGVPKSALQHSHESHPFQAIASPPSSRPRQSAACKKESPEIIAPLFLKRYTCSDVEKKALTKRRDDATWSSGKARSLRMM